MLLLSCFLQLTSSIDLGSLTSFAVVGTTITNTGDSILYGSIAGTTITGSTTMDVRGETVSDASALSDLHTQIANVKASAKALTDGTVTDTFSTTITSSSVLTAGNYKFDSATADFISSSSVVLTLDGSASDVWVFDFPAVLKVGNSVVIELSGGASGSNVYWNVGSSATIGTNVQFVGAILATADITVQTGAVTGPLFAASAVTLDTNEVISGAISTHSPSVAPTEAPTAASTEETQSPSLAPTKAPTNTATIVSFDLTLVHTDLCYLHCIPLLFVLVDCSRWHQ